MVPAIGIINRVHDDFRLIVGMDFLQVLVNLVPERATRLDHQPKLRGTIELIVPTVMARDWAIDLDTGGEPMLNERSCELVRVFRCFNR